MTDLTPAAAARLVAEELGEGSALFERDPLLGWSWEWDCYGWQVPLARQAFAALVAALRTKREQREELERLRQVVLCHNALREAAEAELERLRARVAALEPACANCGGRVPDDACGMAPILLCEPCMERLSHV